MALLGREYRIVLRGFNIVRGGEWRMYLSIYPHGAMGLLEKHTGVVFIWRSNAAFGENRRRVVVKVDY
jgi:hypothetical protein